MDNNKTNKPEVTYSFSDEDGFFSHFFEFDECAIKILPENFQAWIDLKEGKVFSWKEICGEFFKETT